MVGDVRYLLHGFGAQFVRRQSVGAQGAHYGGDLRLGVGLWYFVCLVVVQ